MSTVLATEIITGILIFSAMMMVLVLVVMAARTLLLASGVVRLTINSAPPVSVQKGQKLLNALADHNIFLPAACGGKGACGQCRVTVVQGNDQPLPVELDHLTKQQVAQGLRLACMLRLNGNLAIQVPHDLIARKQVICKVVSNRLVSTFMTELELAPVNGTTLDFQAGDYVLLEAPPQQINFTDFCIPDAYLPEWQRLRLLSLQATIDEPEVRAYSLANSPHEEHTLRLLVRIATPPNNAAPGTPAGKVSSYIFKLKAGESVSLTGPFGDFHIHENDHEMLFIGGGAGMAPLRAMIRHQLLAVKTGRKMSFWYGARSKQQLCYQAEFEQLAQDYPNFSWHIALSEPLVSDGWTGDVGFIHTVVLQHYLAQHPAPENIDYYLCGPPVMSAAVITMLKGLGVSSEQIFNDSFGGKG